MRLETDGLTKHFGGILALDDVSLDFAPGAITALIGPNGAGKTTLFNVIAGFQKPDSGSVFLVEGHGPADGGRIDITGMMAHQVANRGIGVLFQEIRPFNRLSVLDNVAVGGKNQLGESCLNVLFRPFRVRIQEEAVQTRAMRLLEFVGLVDKSYLFADQLSYGQQKLMAIARLLAGDAKILLLDEPTSGVHPSMIDRLLLLIQSLADDGRTVVMIEHNLNVVRSIGDWVYLMAQGTRVEIRIRVPQFIHQLLGNNTPMAESRAENTTGTPQAHLQLIASIECPFRHIPQGRALRLIVGNTNITTEASRQAILKAIARARQWYEQITVGEVGSIEQLAGMHGVSARFIRAQMKLVQLSPQSIERFVSRPESMPLSLNDLLAAIPLDWREQSLGLSTKSA